MKNLTQILARFAGERPKLASALVFTLVFSATLAIFKTFSPSPAPLEPLEPSPNATQTNSAQGVAQGGNPSETSGDAPTTSPALANPNQNFATSFALLVGVDDYDAPEILPPLKYASNDATSLRDALVGVGFDAKNIRLITSKTETKPTKDNIYKALDELIAQASQHPDSTLLVMFSGHGLEPQVQSANAPKDYEKRVSIFFPCNVTELSSDAPFIRLNDVARKLKRVKNGVKIMIVDACRNFGDDAESSDGANKSIANDGMTQLREEERKRLEDDNYEDPFEYKNAGDSGVAFLQSCSSGQKSCESDKLQRGIFSYYLVEGLQDETKDGVTIFNLCDYASKQMKASDIEAAKNQTPFYDYSGPTLFLVPPVGSRGSGLVWGVTDKNKSKTIDELKAFELLTRLRRSDNFGARAELAALYLRGCEGGQVDAKQAFALASEAAKFADLPLAWTTLGACYANGLGVEKNEEEARRCYAKAYPIWQKRAQSGDIVAKFQQGKALLEGNGVKRDRATGFELLHGAAQAGLPAALTRLGEAYLFGQGVAKDERQARQKFLEAYALGDFDAATRLGDCALNGWGVEKNEQEALQYYQEASEANRPAATNALADLYELGHGVAQDDAKALELRRKAAEQNNSTAQKCLGDYYLSGLFGLPVDAKEAVGWYERSVAQNNVDAMLSLAPLLQFGVGGVQRNEVRASELTEKAARLTAQAQLEDGAASFNNDNTSDDAS